MIQEAGLKTLIKPEMFTDWQRYVQWNPEVGGDEGEIETLKLVSRMVFETLAKIPDKTENGVEIEVRVRESPTRIRGDAEV